MLKLIIDKLLLRRLNYGKTCCYVATIIMLVVFSCAVFAADITISSSVDRTDVEFGDTIELTVSIKKPMENQPMTQHFGGNGFSFSFNSSSFSSMGIDDDVDFNIDSIPNFDIAGRRQSSQSRMVNGVGESVKQIILTLVPQKEGSLVIPAFSMKDKDGKEHNSTPITINVRKAAEDPDDEEPLVASSGSDETSRTNYKSPEAKKENTLFNILLNVGIALVFVVFAIIAFASYIGKKNREQTDKMNETAVEDAVIVKEEKKKAEELVVKKDVEKIDFTSRYDSLKRQYKEVSNEFYRKSFDLFKRACCSQSKSLSEDMTFDELLKKIGELAGTKNIEDASSRLSQDIEMVMYANSMPDRKLIELETDMKELLNSL